MQGHKDLEIDSVTHRWMPYTEGIRPICKGRAQNTCRTAPWGQADHLRASKMTGNIH